MQKVYNINTSVKGMGSRSVTSIGLVGYPDYHKFKYGDQLLYHMGRRLTDSDKKVFACVIKAYADNSYDLLKAAKDKKLDPMDAEPLDIVKFSVSVKEISNLALRDRARPARVLDALKKMAGIQIYLLDDEGNERGFIQVIGGAILSDDKKTIEVSFNKNMLRHFASNMISYNFKELMGYSGFSARLFGVMQGRKYLAKKGKKYDEYRYTNISDAELRFLMNNNDKNSKKKFEEAFKEIGINFVLGRNGKWYYPEKEIAQKLPKNDSL